MIPVRIPAFFIPSLASECRMSLGQGHPLFNDLCPVCDEPLGTMAIVLVAIGIPPENRKSAGYTTGAAVAVHAVCAGVPEQEPGTVE